MNQLIFPQKLNFMKPPTSTFFGELGRFMLDRSFFIKVRRNTLALLRVSRGNLGFYKFVPTTYTIIRLNETFWILNHSLFKNFFKIQGFKVSSCMDNQAAFHVKNTVIVG